MANKISNRQVLDSNAFLESSIFRFCAQPKAESTSSKRRHMLPLIKHNLGIYFMFLACLEFALVGFCAKILSDEGLPSIEVMFFRNVIGLAFMIYLLSRMKTHKEGGHFWLLVFRGVVGTISLYLFFYNISHISLGGAFVFQKTSPIFITLIAFFVFKESIGFKGWLGVLVAFCGVLLISQPWAAPELHTGLDLKNSLLGVVSGFFAALALTSVRQLRKYYATEQVAFSFIFIGTIMPLFSMIIGQFYAPKALDFFIAPFVMPSLKAWFFILLMGAVGTIYQIHITKSYGVAKKAGIVAGISYLDVVFSMLLGLALGDKFPSPMVCAGIVAIILGGIILVYRKA